jgi:dipeptidyl aminopeptidase/acylaminoacyl peptidase
LHAWLVTPPAPPPWPAVVLAHGWAAVKEMNLDYVAAAIADAGIAAVVFDHRGFGASEGPRGDLDPDQQIDDYRSVLRLVAARPDVDADRLGAWGTSYSGGHVLCIAAHDSLVRAAVAQVPTISGSEVTRRRYDAATRERMARRAPQALVPAADVGGRAIGDEQRSRTPVAPRDLPPSPVVDYADADRWRFYADLSQERLRTWRNRVTARSLERYAAYEPGRSLPAAARKPLLVIYAEADTITPTDLISDAIAGAGAPVQTLVVPGGHYGVYAAHRDRTAAAAAAFFATHL